MGDAPLQTLFQVTAAADTHIGRRDHNEDAVLLRRDLALYVLADGAGGENAGNVASMLATTAVAHAFERTQEEVASAPPFDVLGISSAAKRLAAAVQHANREVVHLARTSDRFHGMGTTVVTAFIDTAAGIIHLAHVGDSRAYRLRNGVLELLTSDHSLVNDVLELRPDLPEAQARALPRAVITRALGMADTVRVSLRSLAVMPADRYLLCSDGLSDQLDDEQILDAMMQGGSVDVQVRRLLEVANAAGASDNVAVLLLETRADSSAHQRRPPTLRGRRSPQASGRSDASDPEILVIDGDPREAEKEDEDDSAIAAVPGDSVPPGAMDAVKEMVDSLPKNARPGRERDPTVRFSRKCAKCGTYFDGAKDSCPNCWDA